MSEVTREDMTRIHDRMDCVMDKLDEISNRWSEKHDGLKDSHHALDKRVTQLEVRSGIWGAVSGGVTGLIAWAASKLHFGG